MERSSADDRSRPRPARRRLPALGLLVATLACGAPERPPSVLLITLDTTRADRLGCYGRADAGTPAIDALAARGLVFERALAPVPLTLPSHTSLMTASYPPYHGVRDNGLFVVDPALDTLAEEFSAKGLRSAAFVSAFPLQAAFGLDQGFELFDDRTDAGLSERANLMNERRGDGTVSIALTWLGSLEDDEAFFVWVHLFDPHHPYAAPEPFASNRAHDAYQAEIAFVDAQVGRLLAGLASAGRTGDTLVVLTADHGEGLGEFDEPSHGNLLNDGTQRVPLILAGPGVPSAARLDGSVSLVDVAPTLVELAGLGEPSRARFEAHAGRSLVPFFGAPGERGRVAGGLVYMESVYPRLHHGWSELFAIERDGYQYVVAPGARDDDGTPAAELRRVAAVGEPSDARDLAAREPERAAALAADLELLRQRLRPREPFGAREGVAELDVTALDALGYTGLDVEAADLSGDLPGRDPRALIRLTSAADQLRAALELGKLEAAERLLASIRGADPGGILDHESTGLVRLAAAQAAGGDDELLGQARDAFRAAVELAPGRRGLWHRLAEAHRLLDEFEAAFVASSRASSLAPPTPELVALQELLHYRLEEQLRQATARSDEVTAERLRALLASTH